MEKVSKTSKRKDEHLDICLNQDVESSVRTGFQNMHIMHHALPDIDFARIDTSTFCLGKHLAAPLLISSMTGGSPEVTRFNAMFARAAAHFQIAMGVGSQRAAIENADLAYSFDVRKYAPNILLFANIGAVQLNYGYVIDEAQRAIDMIEADALYLHLNPLQEALQPEGNSNFSGLLKKIEQLCAGLETPVFVKEVGSGINANLAMELLNIGVTGIDCAGLGGTSWALVESYRHENAAMRVLCKQFGNWGMTTLDCLLDYRRSGIQGNIIASGGLRTGLDLYKSIALGAKLGGMALPFIRAAAIDEGELHSTIDRIITELKVSMFNTNASKIGEIDYSKIIIKE